MDDTEAAKTTATPSPTFASPLFSFSNPSGASFGFGFGFDSGAPPPPPPPAVEVQLSEESPVAATRLEPVVVDDSLTIYKGRVSTSDVFGVKDSDLLPGKYEGGLKLWEGSLDLVKALNSDIKKDKLRLEGKHVLEVLAQRFLISVIRDASGFVCNPANMSSLCGRGLTKTPTSQLASRSVYVLLGCGHGLPGIFAGLKGADLIHFQDFNAEVLRCLTIPNVKVNLFKEAPEETCTSRIVGFFAGDWSEMDKLLFCGNAEQEKTTSGDTGGKMYNGYDVILMAETVYALSSLPNLYKLIKKCLHYPGGVVYMAGKKHYFGVGGGTRQFVRLVEEDGAMQPERLNDVADGSSNVREVWKLSFK